MKRGDVVVLRSDDATTYANGRRAVVERWELAVAGHVKRTGEVMTARRFNSSVDLPTARCAVYPTKGLTESVAAYVARANEWPGGHPYRPFDSADALKAAIKDAKALMEGATL